MAPAASTEQARSACPPIGARGQVGRTVAASRRLMLNFARPAQCGGVVTGWRFCALNQRPASSMQSMTAIFAIFQPRSPGSLIYSAVNSSLTPISLNASAFEGRGFVCGEMNLAAEDFFYAPQNSVVGVCSSSGPAGLNLISLPSGAQQSMDVRRVENSIYDVCSPSVVAGNNVNVASVNKVAVELHVEAVLCELLLNLLGVLVDQYNCGRVIGHGGGL